MSDESKGPTVMRCHFLAFILLSVVPSLAHGEDPPRVEFVGEAASTLSDEEKQEIIKSILPFQEDKLVPGEVRRKTRAPLLGPPKGANSGDVDALPSDTEVMRAWESANSSPLSGWGIFEIEPRNVRITKEKVADYFDPIYPIPLIGPGQLHHVHFKCTVHYTKVLTVAFPVSFESVLDQDVSEVFDLDHNHFHTASENIADLPQKPDEVPVATADLDRKDDLKKQKKAILEKKVAELKRLKAEILELREQVGDLQFSGIYLQVFEVNESKLQHSAFNWSTMKKGGLKITDKESSEFLKVISQSHLVKQFAEPIAPNLDGSFASLVVHDDCRNAFEFECMSKVLDSGKIRLEASFEITRLAGEAFHLAIPAGDTIFEVDGEACVFVADTVKRIKDNGDVEEIGLVFLVRPTFSER